MKKNLFILAFALAFIACNSKQTKNTEAVATLPDTVALVLHVEGMTCNHCEMTVQGSVADLAGIIDIKADHRDSTSTVTYDASQINIDAITKAIEKKGYKVVGQK